MDANTYTLLEKLSAFLNERADWISPDMVGELTSGGSLSREEACRFLLAAALGIDPFGTEKDRAMYAVLARSLRLLDPAPYLGDSYRKLRFDERNGGNWSFSWGRYAPYEVFVRDDFTVSGGTLIPQLGCFPVEYRYPRVLQDGREWMSVTPNEVHTMERALRETKGRVLTYGLGMGYYLFHALEKPEVTSVTVVERDPEILALFRESLLGQFPRRNDVTLVESDAFEFARHGMAEGGYDTVFTDLWHDAGDGMPLYLKMKRYERYSPRSRFLYWIEDTIRAYLEDGPDLS